MKAFNVGSTLRSKPADIKEENEQRRSVHISQRNNNTVTACLKQTISRSTAFKQIPSALQSGFYTPYLVLRHLAWKEPREQMS